MALAPTLRQPYDNDIQKPKESIGLRIAPRSQAHRNISIFHFQAMSTVATFLALLSIIILISISYLMYICTATATCRSRSTGI